MYTATPPPAVPAPQPAPVPLRLARLEHQVFSRGGAFGGEDEIYFTDLMESYGLRCRPELFHRPRNSLTDMVVAMLPRLEPFARDLDLAILTGVSPDSQPGFPVGRMSDVVPGLGLAFAVFDNGVAAPFTAMRVLASGIRAEHARRAVLLVLDQSTLLHDEPVPARLRLDRDSAVALVLDEHGELGTVWTPQSAVVAAGEVTATLAAVEADTLVCGRGIDAPPEHLPAVPAPHGLPATGVWSVLAANLSRWRGRRVVLADYDADHQRLSHCTVEVAR